MMDERYEDEGEVLIREIEVTSRNQAAYDPIPSQWTLSQQEDRSPPFPSLTRKERIQLERNGFNSPRSQSDDSLSQGNDFAVLEALLEGPHKDSAARIKTDRIVADNEDKSIKSTRTFVDSGDNTLSDPESSSNKDIEDARNNGSTTAYDLIKHPSNQPSKFLSQPSRPTACANGPGLVDTKSHRLPRKFPAVMVSSLQDKTGMNHNAILEKSRKMASKSNKKRTTRMIEEGQPHSTTFASIIGSRPTHWDQRDLSVSNNRKRLKSLDPNGKKSRAAVLSTFTQQSVYNRIVPSSKKQVITPARQSVPNFATIQDPIVDDSEQEKPNETALASFAPSFVSISSSPSPNSNSTLPSPSLQSPQMHPSLGARGRKSKGMFTGRLCKRLQSIRDSVRGDKIRFQSGQYPFSVVSLDMNDPRNRASSVLNVTVLEPSGISNRESQRILMLCFVHNATGSLSQLTCQFSWVCFACDTARELTIEKGSRLRIYNAVPMELSGPLCASKPGTFPAVKWAILATTLCEPYPNELPQLPDVPTILNEHGNPLNL